ncbi:hypothetical protein ACERIT_05130 [Halopenitus sp. H-Gu1]|uniref:hypothetical protein n=1 Tax=Halopenitus sp. H-Gu1 TaxID=3242697 RepID=UPI00359D0EDE
MDPTASRNPQKYHLQETERTYLYAGDTGSYTEGQIRNRITNDRLPLLATRIQHLLDDVTLLTNKDFLTPDCWEDGWHQLQNVEVDREFQDAPVWLPQTELTGHTQIGFVVGQFTRDLISNLGPSYFPERLNWGFLLGTAGQPQGAYKIEHRNITDILNGLNRRFSERKNAAAEQSISSEKARLEREITQAYDSQTLSENSVIQEFSEAAEEARTRYKHRSTNTDHPDFFQLLDKVITASPNEIRAIAELTERIHRSVREVNATHRKKVAATDAFRALYNAEGQQSSDDISTIIGSSKGLVSFLLETLAGGKDNALWTEHPLVEETAAGRRGRQWETTPFGDLVGHCLFDEHKRGQVYDTMANFLTQEQPESEFADLIQQNLKTDL